MSTGSCGEATIPTTNPRFPNTREGLRRAFAGTDRSDLELMLAGNAAEVYDFDLGALAGLAATWGPTVDELRRPYEGIPDGNRSPAFVRA